VSVTEVIGESEVTPFERSGWQDAGGKGGNARLEYRVCLTTACDICG